MCTSTSEPSVSPAVSARDMLMPKPMPVSELAATDVVATLCLKGSCDEDEEVRESALQLSLALIAEEEAPVRAALIAAGAEQRLDELLKTLTDETPSHTEWARQLLEQLR